MKEEEIIIIKEIRKYLEEEWEHEGVLPYDWQVEDYIIEYTLELYERAMTYMLHNGLLQKVEDPRSMNIRNSSRLLLNSLFSEVMVRSNSIPDNKD